MQEKYKPSSKFADKLKAYSTLTAVAVGSSANAAIQYTDINPDSTFNSNGDYYELDLNNDNIVDFTISLTNDKYTYSYGSYFYSYDVKFIQITPEMGNAVSASYISSTYLPNALGPNATVGSNGNFINASTMYMAAKVKFISGTSSYTFSGGNFLGQSNKYLGLKLTVGSNTYYGWARLDVSANSDSFTIKDYAFDDTPNKALLTGIITNIDDRNLARFIQSSIFNKNLQIQSTKIQLGGSELRIVDMNGKTVHSSTLANNDENIDLSQLTSGIYMIDLRAAEGVFRKKIVLEN